MKKTYHKFALVLLIICFNSYFSYAQLQFSKWIVGENTIMNINPNGETNLETYNGIYGNTNQYFTQILSDKDGNPFVKIGHKKKALNEYNYDFGSCYMSMTYINGENCLTNLNKVNSAFPFMMKSPDNKYSYILYSDCSLEYTSQRLYKTQIYCFCKNNFDKSDNGKNILLHEFQGVYIGDARQMQPFLCGMSHTDGKSVWVLSKNLDTDSIVSIKLTGEEIIEKKKRYLI